MTRRPQQNSELIRKVLGSEYLELSISKLTLIEEFDDEVSAIEVVTVDTQGNEQTITGKGCGLVDALFSALMSRYAVEYQSLQTIELAEFIVQARLDSKKASSGIDALGEVTLEVRNSEGELFKFSDESRSIATSTARAVLAVIEYFVNAERAFITLHKGLADAKERNRTDLISRYTRELAEVVKSTSYTEIIDNLRKNSGV